MIDERYKLIIENVNSTVVTAYKPQPRQSTAYQSEAELEAAFIKQLQAQGYEYLLIHSEQELIHNLRTQLEKLNVYQFSDDEWKRLFTTCISKAKILVPSLEEQVRIVSILDKFEALVNDLSQGLPAEIAAVQEQYEYYRNKLLTFEKMS